MQRRRLIYLDALRGIMMIMVLVMHPLMGLVYRSDPGALERMSWWVLILCTPLAIVTTWAPAFALASGTANAYAMFCTLQHNGGAPGSIRKMLLRGLLNGGVLYLLSMISMTFLHHSMEFNGKWQHTLLTGYLVRGVAPSFSPEFLFFNDTLALLSVTSILTTVLLCLLWRDDGFRRLERTYMVVGGLAMLIIVTSSWLHGRFDSTFFQFLNEKRWGAALALKCLIGPRFSPIPLAAYALFGVAFGLGLANGASPRRFRQFGYGSGLAFLTLFAIDAARTGFRLVELTWNNVPMKIHFLDMGLIIITATVLLEVSEFGSPACRARFARWTVIPQRFGRVSLSIFLSEILVSVFILKAYLWLWGVDTLPERSPAAFPFLGLIVLFWIGVVPVWERYGYRYGIEWLMIGLNRKLVGHRSERLAMSPETALSAGVLPRPMATTHSGVR